MKENMNPKIYAEELYKHWTITKEGPEQALKIATRNVEASNPKHWQDLPVGPVFATKGYGSDKWDLNTRLLRKNFNFWTEVLSILKKRHNGTRTK